jgi:hypothetical protein
MGLNYQAMDVRLYRESVKALYRMPPNPRIQPTVYRAAFQVACACVASLGGVDLSTVVSGQW